MASVGACRAWISMRMLPEARQKTYPFARTFLVAQEKENFLILALVFAS